MQQIEAVTDKAGSKVLQLRGEEGAERDQEIQIQQRPGQRPPQPPAQDRQRQQFDEA